MRPASIFYSTVFGALAAASALPAPCAAQDRDRDRDRDDRRRVEIDRWPGGTRVWSLGALDPDRAALGLSLGSGGRSDTLGVRVTEVLRDGPAERAGVEEGDRIVAVGGTSLRVSREDAEDEALGSLANRRLQRALERARPGDEVELQILRGRETRTVRVKTVAAADLPRESSAYGRGFEVIPGRVRGSVEAMRDSARARAERRAALGVSVGATGSMRDTLGLFVSSVTSEGPAERAGITEGDRIASINGVDVRVPREDAEDRAAASARGNRFTRELSKVKPGDNVTLRVYAGGQTRTVTVRAGSAAEVFRNDDNGFGFFYGGDRVRNLMPPMAPLAPMAPMPPMAPMAPMVVPTPPTPPALRLSPRVYYYGDTPAAVRGRVAPLLRGRAAARRVVDI